MAKKLIDRGFHAVKVKLGREDPSEDYDRIGAVRDALLDRPASDWDVATSAHPEQVVELFRRTIPTGLQHGTVTVLVGRGKQREGLEVTTFRGEGALSSTMSRLPVLDNLQIASPCSAAWAVVRNGTRSFATRTTCTSRSTF